MRFGTIGTSYIVRIFLDGAIKNGGTLEAVYSRRQETGEAFAKDYQVTKVYTDLTEMCRDPEIDVIYIASPNSLHYEQAMLALAHHKHVIVEKPMCSTVAECEAMIALAQKNQVFLFEAITNQHLPNYHYIQKILPEIGRIRMVQCNFSQYSSRYDALLAGQTPNVFNPVYSGGALYDINIYNIHFVIGLFGAPQKAYYYANKHPNGIDLSGVAVLIYPDFICECVGAKDSASLNMAEIQGEKGYILVEQGANGCRLVKEQRKDQCISFNEQPERNLLYYENADFKEVIESKDYARRDAFLEESLTVMKVLCELRQSCGLVFAADHKHG